MEWQTLLDLDSFLHHQVAQHAQLNLLGHSSEGRLLSAVQIGSPTASLTIVVIAGFHATEIAGPLAAIRLIQHLLNYPPKQHRFAIVPVADPDRLSRNLAALGANPTTPDLLNLGAVEDLEGAFTTSTYAECQHIRSWLEQFEQIDGYYSLHTAHRVAPGLFFYLGGKAMSVVSNPIAEHLMSMLSMPIPMLAYDPTGFATTVLAPGILALPSIGSSSERVMSESSLAFVLERFNPQMIGVTEVPLGLCSELGAASLAEIENYNRVLAQRGKAALPYQPFTLTMQSELILSFVWAGVQSLSSD